MKFIFLKNSSASEIVDRAVKVLQAGGLIIFPTETTYGAGVDVTNPQAVAKLLAYKARREGKPLSIAVTGREMAKKYVILNEAAEKMYKVFLPGPFTIISKSLGMVALGVESEFGTLGVRIPDHGLVLEIVRNLGRPITATSANASGKKRPYRVTDILNNLSKKQKELIDLIIDEGDLPKNKPSTIIDTTLSTPVVFRAGDRSGKLGAKVGGIYEVSDKNFRDKTSLSVQEDQTKSGNLIARLISESDLETKEIAQRFLLKNWSEIKKRGLIVGLDGDLGVGKTIFTKGVAEFLQIDEIITSPTYSYVNQYDYSRYGVSGQLFHFDVWKIDSMQALERLEFFESLGAFKVVVVEWWDQIREFEAHKIKDKNSRAKILTIKIKDLGGNRRSLEIREM